MAQQKISISASKVLELLQGEIVGLFTPNQRNELYEAFLKSGSAVNPDVTADDFDPTTDEKCIVVTVKSPLFKKSCYKSVTIDIEHDTYVATFTKEEWKSFQPEALKIIKV